MSSEFKNSPKRSKQNQLVSSLVARISPKNSARKSLHIHSYDRIDGEDARTDGFLREEEDMSPMAESRHYESNLKNFCIDSDDENDDDCSFGRHDEECSLNGTNKYHTQKKLPVLPLQIPVEDIPPNFICPLTLQIMEDPVQDTCGHTFERRAILNLLERSNNSVCPISQKPLVPPYYHCDRKESSVLFDDYERILKRNETLQKRILEWKLDHPLYQGLDANFTQHQRRKMIRHNTITDESIHSSNSDNGNQTNLDCPYGDENTESTGDGNHGNKNHSSRDTSHHTLSRFELMFLPQEREALRILKKRTREERERLHRSQRCTWAISVILSVLLLIAVYLVTKQE